MFLYTFALPEQMSPFFHSRKTWNAWVRHGMHGESLRPGDRELCLNSSLKSPPPVAYHVSLPSWDLAGHVRRRRRLLLLRFLRVGCRGVVLQAHSTVSTKMLLRGGFPASGSRARPWESLHMKMLGALFSSVDSCLGVCTSS